MRFCQAFMTELYRHIGPDVDVPAGDLGVGSREIGYLFGQYKRIRNAYENGVLTGKGLSYGGSLIRPEATGYGAVYYAGEVLHHEHDTLEGKTFALSGFGNVAWGAVRKITDLGGKVITLSGPDGFILDEAGVNTQEKLDFMLEMRDSRRDRVQDYADRFGVPFFAGEKPWGVKADVLMPCATQNEVDLADARRIAANGVKYYIEVSNMPTTADAMAFLTAQKGMIIAPSKAVNAGGVATSALRCARTPCATAGPPRRWRRACAASWSTSTTPAPPPRRRTASATTSSRARTSRAFPRSPRRCSPKGSSEAAFCGVLQSRRGDASRWARPRRLSTGFCRAAETMLADGLVQGGFPRGFAGPPRRCLPMGSSKAAFCGILQGRRGDARRRARLRRPSTGFCRVAEAMLADGLVQGGFPRDFPTAALRAAPPFPFVLLSPAAWPYFFLYHPPGQRCRTSTFPFTQTGGQSLPFSTFSPRARVVFLPLPCRPANDTAHGRRGDARRWARLRRASTGFCRAAEAMLPDGLV